MSNIISFSCPSLNIRADEGRVTEADLKSAGVNRLMAEKSNEEHKYNSDDSDSLLSQPASNNHSFDFDEDEFTIDDGYSEHIDDDNVDEIVEKCWNEKETIYKTVVNYK